MAGVRMKYHYIATIILGFLLYLTPNISVACFPTSIDSVKSLMSNSHFRCLDGHIPNEAMQYLKAGEAHYKNGNILSADQHIRYGLWVATRTMGRSNPEIVRLLNAIGNLYMARGDWKKSEQYLYTAIDSAKRIEATSNIDMKSLIGDLGTMYKRQGLSSRDAERLYNSALNSLNINPRKWNMSLPSFNEAISYVKKKAKEVGGTAKETIRTIK